MITRVPLITQNLIQLYQINYKLWLLRQDIHKPTDDLETKAENIGT